MNITPLDIKKTKFKTKMMGYDKEEVESFLEIIAVELENQIKETNENQNKVKEMQNKIDEYHRIEKTLQETLVVSQKASDELRESAKDNANNLIKESEEKAAKIIQEAEEIKSLAKEKSSLIIEQAEMKAEKIVLNSEQKTKDLKSELQSLLQRKEEIYWAINQFLNSQLNMLESNFKPMINKQNEEDEENETIELPMVELDNIENEEETV